MRTTAVIIGGGATGVGILRDLSMRGIPAILLEQGDLAHGTSSRFHGLLHSGARYAVNDAHSARECVEENTILRRMARACVETGEGLFVRVAEDDPAFVPAWLEACANAGIETRPLPLAELRRNEPRLSGTVEEVYTVPDAVIDGFRLVWHNARSARRYGGEFFTRCRVVAIERQNGRVTGVRAVRTANAQGAQDLHIACDFCINATGAWAGLTAHAAGLDVRVAPDRGSLIVFNHRFVSRVINRLRPASDGDIFVPHGSVTVYGTTSTPTDTPDNSTPTTEEALRLLALGKPLFPDIEDYRILRVFAGSRPLYAPGGAGRAAGRGFHIVDHREDGLIGMLSIFGGKLTTYRLMAEKLCDLAAAELGVSTPCRTAEEPLTAEPSPELLQKARRFFPAYGVRLVADRLGDEFGLVVESAAESAAELICECEMVTRAEVEHVAREPGILGLGDIRLRTRLGMGTCQGTFCALRAAALPVAGKLADTPAHMLHSFLRERWKGLRPVLWGTQLKEVELTRAVYAATLNMDANLSGEMPSSPALPAEACGLHPSLFALDTTSDRDCRTPFPTAESTPAKEARSVAPSTGALEGALPPRSPLPSHPDIIVIGAGMAGLIAACTAADAGASVTVIGAGAGALGISSGCVDILGYVNGALFEGKPSDAPALLPAGHPYRIAGAAALRDATAFFLELCREEGYEFIEPGTYFLPTLMGTLKPTALCPASMHPGPLACAKRVCVAAFEGMRDWRPDFIAGQLKCLPAFVGKHFSFASVPSPRAQGRRSLNAPDMARLADSETGLRALTAALRPHAAKTDILLLPPVCGTRPDTGVYRALCDDLGCAVVEMVGMPPGVGGLRLYRLLLHALRKRGATVEENSRVVRAESENGLCRALVLQDGSRRRARAFILAAGGILGSGLAARPASVQESIFGFPVFGEGGVWADAEFFGTHAFARMGLAVNGRMAPLDTAGSEIYRNVHAAGRILAGYDFATEKSGNGVALTTGRLAAKEAVAAMKAGL